MVFFVSGKGADDDSGGSDTSKRMVNQSEFNRIIEVGYLNAQCIVQWICST